MSKVSGIRVDGWADGCVLEITLDRADRGNALSASVFRELADIVEQAGGDSSIGALLIRASGESFCMGGDISDDRGRRDPRYPAALHDFSERWLSRSLPALALVEGGAQAYGCALALSSDLVFATESAWFSLPELSHGLVPVYALAVLSASGRGGTGARLMWEGQRFSAQQVSELEQHVVLCSSSEKAAEGIADVLDGWLRGGVQSLRGAKQYTDAVMDVGSQHLVGAREALHEALAAADDDPAKAQSYLTTKSSE